jgi:hypothetical protein
MLLLVSCLPSLARPYRELEQQPLIGLAKAAHRLRGKAEALYMLGRPRYSVVADAQMPTIFSSPLKPASPRPVSSYANWKRHLGDQEALVIGRCKSVKELMQAPSLTIRVLEQERDLCLARLQRISSQP